MQETVDNIITKLGEIDGQKYINDNIIKTDILNLKEGYYTIQKQTEDETI